MNRFFLLSLTLSLASCLEFFPVPAGPPPSTGTPVRDPIGLEPEPEPEGEPDDPGEPEPGEPEPEPEGDITEPVILEATEQREGDPVAGLAALVSNDYVGCGIPSWFVGQVSPQLLDAPEWLQVDGRPEEHTSVQYDYNVFVNHFGVEVAAANCLSCHAAPLQGQLIMGLGDANRDFSGHIGNTVNVNGSFIFSGLELASYEKWQTHMAAVADYIQVTTRGSNPADNLAAALFAHRDPDTLAWSEEPLLEMPETTPVPTDVPAWWLMNKKNAMLYTGAGRGDHSRIMMTASTLCVNDTVAAQAIYDYMDDVRAFISSIPAPLFPGAIDDNLAASGEDIFVNRCAGCHGTYGDHVSYPNLLIPAADVGTDPMLAQGSSHLSERFVDWFNDSFYGQTASLVPEVGYVAPPLDGVWATAPYFHNGSVPRLSEVLNSSARPASFVRSFNPDDYELDDPGWPLTTSDLPTENYNTSLPGHSNQGHTFADDLDETERAALLEYLKTL